MPEWVTKASQRDKYLKSTGSRFGVRRAPGQFTRRPGSQLFRRATPCRMPEAFARKGPSKAVTATTSAVVKEKSSTAKDIQRSATTRMPKPQQAVKDQITPSRRKRSDDKDRADSTNAELP